LTTSIEQCAASLASKFGEFHRQDEQLVVGIAELQHAVKTLKERSSVTPDDCEAIKSEIQALGLQIAQSMSVEATNNTALAEVSSAVEGIIQAHVKTLCHGLERLESASAQTAVDASAQVALRVELQGMVDRLKKVENQLESASQCKAKLEKSLSQSTARVAELEASSTITADSNTEQVTPQDVENKVTLHRGITFTISVTNIARR
jgi:chromosome segregation ATPase